jgi:hypothetical protein
MLIRDLNDDWIEWALARFKKGRISNVLFSDFCERNPDMSILDLTKTDIIILGTVAEGRKGAFKIRLLANRGSRLFVGPFQVLLDGHASWCESLPTLKSKTLGIEDKLSFERSAYIVVAEGGDGRASSARLIRLRCIRPLCYLPPPEGAVREKRYQHKAMLESARRYTTNQVATIMNVYMRVMPQANTNDVAEVVTRHLADAMVPYSTFDARRIILLGLTQFQEGQSASLQPSDEGSSLPSLDKCDRSCPDNTPPSSLEWASRQVSNPWPSEAYPEDEPDPPESEAFPICLSPSFPLEPWCQPSEEPY